MLNLFKSGLKYSLVLLFLSNPLRSQCNSGTAYGTLNPNNAWQSYTSGWGGEYQTFTAVAGVTYEFSYCPADGGSSSYDSEITILDASLTPVTGGYNDDFCGDDAYVQWTCPADGTYYILTTQSPCLSNSTSSTLRYRIAPDPFDIVHESGSTTIACGSTYTYYDPGFDGNYSNNTGPITFTIYPDTPGSLIELVFSAFGIEPGGGSCIYDYMEIYDGNSTASPLLGTFCNDNIPGTITSTSGPLTIVFYADGFTTDLGWIAEVNCITPCPSLGGTANIDLATGCSQDVTLSLTGNDPGTIQWQVSTDGGSSFTDITGATSATYVYNATEDAIFRVELNDGCTYYSSSVNYTQDCPEIIHPDVSDQTVTIDCGTTYFYYDPGGEGAAYNNGVGPVTLTILPDVAGNEIQIDFTSFGVEAGGGSCIYDYVDIYDGNGAGAIFVGRFCNDNIPTTITSTNGALVITFYSDSFTNDLGWEATISCVPPCTIAGGSIIMDQNIGCNANINLNVYGYESGASIQWQVSTDNGGSWSNVSGATSTSLNQSPTATTLYRVLVDGSCVTYSDTVQYVHDCGEIFQNPTGATSQTISCGSTYLYYDSGASGSGYGNSENGLITICPDAAGNYLTVDFTSFNIENGFDYLYVFDGGDASAPILGVYTGTSLSGVIGASSTNTSGCLSFRFVSDDLTTSAGWTAEVSCTSVASAIVPSANVEDCQGSIVICSDANLFGGVNSNGYNELPDEWNSCIDGGENQSTWYVFSPATAGTVEFEIIPDSPTDYDWAIWGPYNDLSCPSFTNDDPVRCSSTQLIGNGNTGLLSPATDVIEQNGEYGGGANENGFLAPLNVQEGEVYIMMLDNWDVNSVGFTIDWTLTNGATLDCTPLPVTMTSMEVQCDGSNNKITWSCASEMNSDYFAIEKSDNNGQFVEIGRVQSSGASGMSTVYEFTDPEMNLSTSYYRIKQVDLNGAYKNYRVMAANCYQNKASIINVVTHDHGFVVNMFGTANENANLGVYDMSGKIIASEEVLIEEGLQKLAVNKSLSEGVYLLLIQSQNQYMTTKIMVSK